MISRPCLDAAWTPAFPISSSESAPPDFPRSNGHPGPLNDRYQTTQNRLTKRLLTAVLQPAWKPSYSARISCFIFEPLLEAHQTLCNPPPPKQGIVEVLARRRLVLPVQKMS